MLDRVTTWLTWFAGLMAVVMMIHVTADVTGRTLFNAPIVGTLEIVSAYYMAALSFLPLALITRERGHIIVELFTGWMTRRGRTLLDAAVAIVSLIYVALFTWQAVLVAIEKTEMREAREAGIGFVPIWQSRWVVPIGFGLMAIYLLIYIVKDVRSARTGVWDDDEGLGVEAHVPSGEDHL
jgi:TRAP-type C4-dicarboxylate transport system permease small subunit